MLHKKHVSETQETTLQILGKNFLRGKTEDRI